MAPMSAVADPPRLLAAPQRRLHHAAAAAAAGQRSTHPAQICRARAAPSGRLRCARPLDEFFVETEIGGGSTLHPVRNGMGTGGAWGRLQRLGVGGGGGSAFSDRGGASGRLQRLGVGGRRGRSDFSNRGGRRIFLNA
jgi:hypothetical protein